MEKKLLHFTLNGDPKTVAVKPGRTLVQVLREDLGMTGTKRCCNSGACSSCSVLVDGQVVNACSVLACQVENKEVSTVEGVAEGGTLHPLQESFLDEGGLQCGFCTPGMIMAAQELLSRNLEPTAEDVRHQIAGNLCRCTGYVKIVNSILTAAKRMREAQS